MKNKTYYSPISTFLVFGFYVVLGVVLTRLGIFSTWSIGTILLAVILVGILIERTISFSYRLSIIDNNIHERGFFIKGRSIPVNSITRIRWRKEKFWTLKSWRQETDWQRQFYIESPEGTLPAHPISKTLIKDLLIFKPGIVVEK